MYNRTLQVKNLVRVDIYHIATIKGIKGLAGCKYLAINLTVKRQLTHEPGSWATNNTKKIVHDSLQSNEMFKNKAKAWCRGEIDTTEFVTFLNDNYSIPAVSAEKNQKWFLDLSNDT